MYQVAIVTDRQGWGKHCEDCVGDLAESLYFVIAMSVTLFRDCKCLSLSADDCV
jgi:hypothetical protein